MSFRWTAHDTKVWGERAKAQPLVLFAAALAVSCSNQLTPPYDDRLSQGTWGGDNAGVIVDDTIAHVHIGCTFGDFAGPTALDAQGHFSKAGSYVLRAYPIQIGPSMPAQFSGTVDGNKLTLTVVVNDTIEKKPTTLGPVLVVYGKEPQMGPCPICRKPGERQLTLRAASSAPPTRKSP